MSRSQGSSCSISKAILFAGRCGSVGTSSRSGVNHLLGGGLPTGLHWTGAAEHAARYADGYRSAWAAGDVGSAVSLFGDEVVYRSTPFRQPHQGREGVREYTTEAFAEERVEDVRFAVLAVEGSTAVYEYWTTLEESGQAHHADRLRCDAARTRRIMP